MQYFKKKSFVVTKYWLNGQGNNTMSEWSSVRNLSETYILFSIVLIFFCHRVVLGPGPKHATRATGAALLQQCSSTAAALRLSVLPGVRQHTSTDSNTCQH